MTSKDVFQRYGAYYDLLYHDKNYPDEAKYVIRLLQSSSPGARDLLEFGSGTGRHGRLLASHGFNVFGIERSEAMVSTAEMSNVVVEPLNHGSFRCMQGDIRTVNVDRSFDAVLSLFHVISYQTENSDLSETFLNAARHLRAGGVFLFDVWHGPAVLTQRPSVRIKRVEDNHTFLTRIAEPELNSQSSVVTVNYTMLAESKSDRTLTTFHEQHRMRYFFPAEIDLLATRAGLEVERQEEFLTGLNASETTWGVVYLLRKMK